MTDALAATMSGDVRAELARASALLEQRPEQALECAEAVLRRAPGLPPAELLACQALRRAGRTADALPRLERLARPQPAVPALWWELAHVAIEMGHNDRAISALERLTRHEPMIAEGWFLLARILRLVGRDRDGWRADLSGVHAASRDPGLIEAALAMNGGRLDEAQERLERRRARHPGDPVGIRLLGEVVWRRGDIAGAVALVERAVAIAPGFDLATLG